MSDEKHYPEITAQKARGDWNPMWDIVGRGSYPKWHSPGLCVDPQTFEPVPVGPECRTKRDYEAFIESCTRRAGARPCLCTCNV